jgi:hypothetical protein
LIRDQPPVGVVGARDNFAGNIDEVGDQPARVAGVGGGEGGIREDGRGGGQPVHHVVGEREARRFIGCGDQVADRVVGKGFVSFVPFLAERIPRHQPVEGVVGVAYRVARAVGGGGASGRTFTCFLEGKRD